MTNVFLTKLNLDNTKFMPNSFSSVKNLKQKIEYKILDSILLSSIKVSKITSDYDEVFRRHQYLQGQEDVHGSHLLFYWSRCRGEGFVVNSSEAAVLLHYSIEMRSVVLTRPVGELSGIVELINSIANVVVEAVPDQRVVVRYCGIELANKLRKSKWQSLKSPLLASAYEDDETWPEVILNQEPQFIPQGRPSHKIRMAVYRHSKNYTYRQESKLLNIGELDLIEKESARIGKSDSYEQSFNKSILEFLRTAKFTGLGFHYLLSQEGLAGFCITGRNFRVSHNYYLGVKKEARLATFLGWKVYLNERASGATEFNIGGSERESLFRYNVRTFPEHRTRLTQPLEFIS